MSQSAPSPAASTHRDLLLGQTWKRLSSSKQIEKQAPVTQRNRQFRWWCNRIPWNRALGELSVAITSMANCRQLLGDTPFELQITSQILRSTSDRLIEDLVTPATKWRRDFSSTTSRESVSFFSIGNILFYLVVKVPTYHQLTFWNDFSGRIRHEEKYLYSTFIYCSRGRRNPSRHLLGKRYRKHSDIGRLVFSVYIYMQFPFRLAVVASI